MKMTSNGIRKQSNIDRSIILVIRIVIRVLGFSSMFIFFSRNSIEGISEGEWYHNTFSFVYYILFLIFLNGHLKSSMKNIPKQELLIGTGLAKSIAYFKWVLLGLTLLLMVISFIITPIEWPVAVAEKILFFITKIIPGVFGPNVGFIIISMLVFYASSVINISKRLKLEQELTI